jgi:hypothetical protein
MVGLAHVMMLESCYTPETKSKEQNGRRLSPDLIKIRKKMSGEKHRFIFSTPRKGTGRHWDDGREAVGRE